MAAKWRYRNKEVEHQVELRALQKALFTGDLGTAARYLQKIDELIKNIEAFPYMGQACGKANYRYSVLGTASPGEGDVLVWSWDGINLVGEGIYQSLPPEYLP
ncbi:MAG: hypothetical protein FJ146_14540 [Deltaproteobacteria bacterium]|nr:hypothetical protein [Deltaproteobacteria bacterium]